jgi:uncharacterized protein with HEPN domain
MKSENLVRLKHILDAISKIESYLQGYDETQFYQDGLRQDGVIRQLEIIGEAAKNLTNEFRENHSHIPWKQICGIRDRLAHGYYEISLKIVWDTTQSNLPILKNEVARILDVLDETSKADKLN